MSSARSPSPANMITFLCIILAAQYASSDIVPVLMWGTAMRPASVPAIGPIGTETFEEIVKSCLESKPRVVIFTERNLSPEDFIESDRAGKNTFNHLSQLQTSSKITYFPFVENPLDVFKQLEDHKIVTTSINDYSNKQKVGADEISLIDLNDAKDNEDRNDMLMRHDEAIYSIAKESKNENTLFIYTGHHASWIIPEVAPVYKGRNLLAEAKAEETVEAKAEVIKTEIALIYFNSSVIFHKEGLKEAIELSDFDYAIGENRSSVTLTPKVKAAYSLELFFNTTDTGYWTWYQLNVKNTADEKDVVEFKIKDIIAPEKFSYHCISKTMYLNSAKKDTNITFPGLQIQFNETLDSFGDAYDCVGFTSAPIWSGLFVTLILAFIMTMGLTMMLDIKTMDRFDDPKGKTIIINAAE